MDIIYLIAGIVSLVWLVMSFRAMAAVIDIARLLRQSDREAKIKGAVELIHEAEKQKGN